MQNTQTPGPPAIGKDDYVYHNFRLITAEIFKGKHNEPDYYVVRKPYTDPFVTISVRRFTYAKR